MPLTKTLAMLAISGIYDNRTLLFTLQRLTDPTQRSWLSWCPAPSGGGLRGTAGYGTLRNVRWSGSCTCSWR